jgi:serine/tyrosine/threonine adenylyltransferase
LINHKICYFQDTGGRYTLRQQPNICEWNCIKLAEALNHPALPLTKSKSIVEKVFKEEFNRHYLNKMRKKV